MAEQQLPDINGYINALPIGVDKQDKLFDAFYSDNPKSALEAIQDVPKEVRQSLLTIRGKIHKGEQYDLNDIVKSYVQTEKPSKAEVPQKSEATGLSAREEGEAESRVQSAKAARELALKRWEQSISKIPTPSKSPKVTPSPFARKAEPEVDEFGRPATKPGPRLVPSLPKFGQSGERATEPPPTVKPSVKPTETTEAPPAIQVKRPPVEEVYSPSVARDVFNATVRGVASGLFAIPRVLSRVPGGLREDLEALRPVESDTQRGGGFIGKEAREREDALNRQKTARLIAKTEQEALPEAPLSAPGKLAEAVGSTAPYIVAGMVGGKPASAALGAAAGAEEALTRADISGKPLTEGQRKAIGTAGAGIGLTEAIPIERIVSKLKGAGVAGKSLAESDIVKLLFPKLGDFLKSGATQAGTEAFQEGLSGLAQDALESMYGGRPISEIGSDVLEQAATGGGAGLVIDMLSTIVGSRAGRRKLKSIGVDPKAFKDWVESGGADKAKAEAQEYARKALTPAAQLEAPAQEVSPEPPPVVPEPPPVVDKAKVVKPPKVSTEPPPVVTATAEPPIVEVKTVEETTEPKVKDLEITDPFSGTTETIQVPSSIADKYETLTDLQKEAAAGNFLSIALISPDVISNETNQIDVISNEIKSIKDNLAAFEQDPESITGLEPYFDSLEDYKSFVNEITIPYLEYVKSAKAASEPLVQPSVTQPTTTPPPPAATAIEPEPQVITTAPPQPAAPTVAAQIAHPKLNNQGQPVIINTPSTPTPDTTWTDPGTTAVFVPYGDAPDSIGGTKIEPWSPPQEGWSKVSGVNERLDTRKPFTPSPSKQSASGVIVVEDDGRVWLISPTNQFGGYDNTFPKGKLDPGLTMQENAIKEAWEETGLKVDIIGVVGDYEKSTSKVRYYLAKRTGGTPKNMGWEAQAVKLATLDDAKSLLNQQIDKDIISDLEKMISSGKLAEIKDGTPRKLSTYGQEVAPKTGGSNPGGWYKDGSTEWLVKGNSKKVSGAVTPEQSDNRAANEVLASKLIRSVFKVGAPEMKLIDLEGKYGGGLGVASKKVPSLYYFNPNNSEYLKAAQKAFAIHAWLANYDVLGMGYDNLSVNQNYEAVNIDPGGALLFRAQGLPKGASHGVVNGLLDPSAPEFESMRTTTPEQKAVFGKMTASQLKDSAKSLESITDEKIKKLVNTYGWGSDADKAALAENLIQRKNSILQKAGVTATSSVPQATAQPPIQPSATQPLPASPQVSQQATTAMQTSPTPSQVTAAQPATQIATTQAATTPVLTQMADLSTNQGKFSIPQQFLDKYNQMTQDNKNSFVKVLNKVAGSRTSTGSSAASMPYVQDQISIANQKISEYDQKITSGTATDFDKERKKYYSELVKPYLEYIVSSGKIAKATGYVAPSGAALASISAIPPRPQWVQSYKAQSKGIVTKGSISNEDALNNYAFLAGLFGKSHSEAKKANTILKNAQKKNGNIQPSIIDQAIQEAKQKYLQFQPFLQVIDKKWIGPISQYFTEKQPGDEFKFPYSSQPASVPASDIDAGKKDKFKVAQTAVISNLNTTQKNTLKSYTGTMANSVNTALGEYFNSGNSISEANKKRIKTMDAAFKKSKLGENVKLVRNIGSKYFWKWFGMDEGGIADSNLDLLKGKSYTEICYVSTSKNPDSSICLQDTSKGKIKFIINAGKNFHGIDVSSLSSHPESEVILSRGTTYVIREIKHTQSGYSPSSNVWEVFVDIVDQTPGEIQ
jgi:ADP-ribose pyrophosphatase YjhB (NUDIX family)